MTIRLFIPSVWYYQGFIGWYRITEFEPREKRYHSHIILAISGLERLFTVFAVTSFHQSYSTPNARIQGLPGMDRSKQAGTLNLAGIIVEIKEYW